LLVVHGVVEHDEHAPAGKGGTEFRRGRVQVDRLRAPSADGA
jgi:hypothetical protein